MRKLLVDCLWDEQGTELLETALVLGLVVIGAIGLMGAFGLRVYKRWELIAEDI